MIKWKSKMGLKDGFYEIFQLWCFVSVNLDKKIKYKTQQGKSDE